MKRAVLSGLTTIVLTLTLHTAASRPPPIILVTYGGPNDRAGVQICVAKVAHTCSGMVSGQSGRASVSVWGLPIHTIQGR